MNISKGIEIVDLALFIKKERILIMSDLHIGQEAAMNREGMLIPRFQHKDLVEKTKTIIKQTQPKTIILNGDIKHEFASISREEWKQVQSYLDLLQNESEVIIIKGNHDKIIEPIAERKGIKLINHYMAGDTYICHGDLIPKDDDYKKSKTIIIGHEHPAIELREGSRAEKYKCFIKGKISDAKSKELIVMPSMNMLTEGSDVLNEKLLSPFLKNANLDKFEVWIAESEIFYFGKLKNLKK